eukprot:48799_1
MSNGSWHFCITIIVDYIDDIDASNLVATLDEVPANTAIEYWRRNRLQSFGKRIENESKTIGKSFKPYLPNYNNTSWGYGTTDHGYAYIKCFKIKQDLSNVDISEYCKSFWFHSLVTTSLHLGYGWNKESYGDKVINSFEFDSNKIIDLKSTFGIFKNKEFCANKYEWKVLCNLNQNINIQKIASIFNENTSKWVHKKDVDY